MRKLSRDTAFIISSHNLYEIEDICSSVIILDKGKLIANKPIAELAHKDKHLNLTLNRQADEELLQALQEFDGIKDLNLDKLNPEKITLNLGEGDLDELQLQIQRLIMDKGYAITDLSRGKALIEGMMDLVDDD